jgi:hypothetical protein
MLKRFVQSEFDFVKQYLLYAANQIGLPRVWLGGQSNLAEVWSWQVFSEQLACFECRRQLNACYTG